jgi:hypothetical protein
VDGLAFAEGTWTARRPATVVHAALPGDRRAAVAERVAVVASDVVSSVLPMLSPTERAAFLDGYDAALTLLVRGGWLPQSQADTLSRSAAAL